MSDNVRIIKFDVGSPTDEALRVVQTNLNASSSAEAFRRSVAIAKFVTQATKEGKTLILVDGEGNERKLEIV